MGGKPSIHIQTPQFQDHLWQYQSTQILYPQYGMYRTLSHKTTGELIDQYTLNWINQEQYSYYLKSFNWRCNQPNVVNTKFIVQKSQRQFCAQTFSAKVYIEHPLSRLSEIKDVPYPQNLYVMMEALEGYSRIYVHSKYFCIEESQICVDPEGNVKVWVNSDLSMNYPNSEERAFGEEQMAERLVHIVAENTDRQSEPQQTFLQYFIERKGPRGKKFEQTKVLVLDYARTHDQQIPQRFESILTLGQSMQQYTQPEHQQFEHYNHQDATVWDNNAFTSTHNMVGEPMQTHPVAYVPPPTQTYYQGINNSQVHYPVAIHHQYPGPMGNSHSTVFPHILSTRPQPLYYSPPVHQYQPHLYIPPPQPIHIPHYQRIEYPQNQRMQYPPPITVPQKVQQQPQSPPPDLASALSSSDDERDEREEIEEKEEREQREEREESIRVSSNKAKAEESQSNQKNKLRANVRSSNNRSSGNALKVQDLNELPNSLSQNQSPVDIRVTFNKHSDHVIGGQSPQRKEQKLPQKVQQVQQEHSQKQSSRAPSNSHQRNNSYQDPSLLMHNQDGIVTRSLPIKGGIPGNNQQPLSSFGLSQNSANSHLQHSSNRLGAQGYGLFNSKEPSVRKHDKPRKMTMGERQERKTVKYFYSLDEELEIDPDIAADLAKYLG